MSHPKGKRQTPWLEEAYPLPSACFLVFSGCSNGFVNRNGSPLLTQQPGFTSLKGKHQDSMVGTPPPQKNGWVGFIISSCGSEDGAGKLGISVWDAWSSIYTPNPCSLGHLTSWEPHKVCGRRGFQDRGGWHSLCPSESLYPESSDRCLCCHYSICTKGLPINSWF